jgi:hypothetical protein
METPPIYSVRPKLDFSAVYSRTFSTFFNNFSLFIALAAIAALPGALLEFIVPAGIPKAVAILLFKGLLSLWAMGAICYAACQLMDGNTVSIGESLGQSLPRLLPLIGASLLSLLVLAGGFVALVVPGIIVSCMLIVTAPVCVREKLGPYGSMNRSAILTKGNRWLVFLILLVLVVCASTLGSIAGVMSWGALAFSTSGSLNYAAAAKGINIISALIAMPITALFNILTAVVYHDLRAIEEGSAGLGAAAKVFD